MVLYMCAFGPPFYTYAPPGIQMHNYNVVVGEEVVVVEEVEEEEEEEEEKAPY